MDPSVLPLAVCNLLDRLGSLILVWQPEGKLCIQARRETMYSSQKGNYVFKHQLKIVLVPHRARAVGELGKYIQGK